MSIHDYESPDTPCFACGAPAEDTRNWGYHPFHGAPCQRPLCWDCAIVTNDKEGRDMWCPEYDYGRTV
jgi:hypothetical protein